MNEFIYISLSSDRDKQWHVEIFAADLTTDIVHKQQKTSNNLMIQVR